MKIRRTKVQDHKTALRLFNAYAEEEVIYKRISEEVFEDVFVKGTERDVRILLSAIHHEQVIGFAAGTLVKGKTIGYITYLVVNRQFRGRGVGGALLGAMESALKEEAVQEGLPLEKIQMTFFNPANLRWIIPDTPRHDHPNAPGVDMKSYAYEFFKRRGYTDRVFQNVFYQPMKNFSMAKELKEKREKLAAEGLIITYFDPEKHVGAEELYEDLGSDLWKEENLANIARGKAMDPLVSVIDEKTRKIVGFAGPIHIEESGRGYFSGIGVHSAYRGKGLGTILFSSLCQAEKEAGAAFMSLFTGPDNPAGRIYEGAGFKVVRTFSDLEKKLDG